MDIRAITKNVVERIRASGDADSFSMDADISMSDISVLDQPLTPDDRRKIEALEWLVFDPSQRAEALKQSNAVIRHFLGKFRFFLPFYISRAQILLLKLSLRFLNELFLPFASRLEGRVDREFVLGAINVDSIPSLVKPKI